MPARRACRSYHDLSGRPKHLWGVYKKMAAKGYSLGRISDVRGLRIIVDSKADCYRALRAVEVRRGMGGGGRAAGGSPGQRGPLMLCAPACTSSPRSSPLLLNYAGPC